MAGREVFGGADRDFAIVPDIVKQFVVYLYRHIRERNIPEITSMYEISFPKLSERYFKQSSWPPVHLVSDLVDQDHVFCLLYQEMYFRHLYAKTSPGLQARCDSWDNYYELFGVILSSNVNMQLPTVWLWDMVDEFVYQFQSFCQYRSKLSSKSAEEVELLRQCEAKGVWSIVDVLNILQALIDASNIAAELAADGGAALLASEGYAAGQSNVLRMLGYFSLPGLLRVHSLIGDYQTALEALAPLNPHVKDHLFTPKLPTCNITLYYYSSFAYLMLRRYTDAGACLNTILSYISRVKGFLARTAQYEQILQKNEQMYAMLAIAVALCPAVQKRLDEAVLNALREKYADKMARMGRGDEGSFDELFTYACPKFITASPPSYDAPTNTFQEAYRAQLHLFLKEVRSCQALPLLKQYLLLYSSISIPKLASLLETDEAALRTSLMCLKNKNYCLQWSGGASAVSGNFTSTSDIDFYIDTDAQTGAELVVVSDSVHTRHQAELLARHIVKFEEIVRDLEAPVKPAAAPAAASAAG